MDNNTLERMQGAYAVAKELGFHKNEYWSSIKRSIDRMVLEQQLNNLTRRLVNGHE